VGQQLLEQVASRGQWPFAVMSLQRHTLYNMVGGLAPIALSLATIPIYVSLIGEARFGVIAIIWLTLAYFGLFDLGLGKATAQRLAQKMAGNLEQRARIFWTALSMNLALGLAGGALAWPLASLFLSHMLATDSVLQSELRSALPWLALAVPVLTLSSVLSGALQGRERFLDLNAVAVVGATLSQLLPLAGAAVWAPRIDVLVPLIVAARALALLVLMQRCRQHVFGNQAASFDCDVARSLLGYGGWVTVTAIVGPMMVIMDRFAIGALFGAKAVSHYTIPFQLAEGTTVLSTALNSALFPRLSASTQSPALDELSSMSMRLLAVLMTPLIGAAILWLEPFLTWWISAEMAANATLSGQLLFLGFWINGLALVSYTQLQARGHPDWVAKCHLAELPLYLVLLYAGLRLGGVPGAALAFLLRALVDFMLLSVLAKTMASALRVLPWPAILLLMTFAVSTDSWAEQPWAIGWRMLALVAILAWSWIQMPAPARAMLLARKGARP
jgi:O-antigen/teichoic acid export membrane protein